MTMPKALRRTRAGERGASLIVVTVVLLVILVGGLAAVAVVNGQLERSRGYRTQEASEACARAALERARAYLPTNPAGSDITSSVAVPGAGLTYYAGHYSAKNLSTTNTAIEVLDPSTFDASALYQGENIANVLGAGSGAMDEGVHVLKVTTICEGPHYPAREVETIFKFGIAVGAR